MAGIQVHIDGGEEISKALANANRKLERPVELYQHLAKHLLASTLRRFETETDPDGSPWPQSLRAKVQGGKTLRDKGNLYRSIKAEVYDDGLAIGSNAIQAAIHQFGGVITAKKAKGLAFIPIGSNSPVFVKSVTMPRRSFLGLDDQDKRDIIEATEDYLANSIDQGAH